MTTAWQYCRIIQNVPLLRPGNGKRTGYASLIRGTYSPTRDVGPPVKGRAVTAYVMAGVLCLAACTANEPPGKPTHMVQPGDEQLSCPDINAQMKANLTASVDLLKLHKDIETGQIVGGFLNAGLIGALLASKMSDWNNVQQVEARSLIDRNERLTFLARSKGCSET